MDTLKTTDDLLSGDAVKLTFTGDVTRSLLIVDDDAPFRTRLARAMEKRGFNVVAVHPKTFMLNCIPCPMKPVNIGKLAEVPFGTDRAHERIQLRCEITLRCLSKVSG